jgi:hypothetical protein
MTSRHDPLLPPLPEQAKPDAPIVSKRPLTRPLIDLDQVEARVVNDDPITVVTSPYASTYPSLPLPRSSSPQPPVPLFAPFAAAPLTPTARTALRPRALRSRDVAILVVGLSACLAILVVATLLLAQPAGSPLPGSSALQLVGAATATALPTATPITPITPSPALTATASATGSPTASPSAAPTGSPTASSTTTPGATSPTTAATFVAFDRATQGTWQGIYGNAGYLLAGDTQQQQLPADVQVTLSSAASTLWAASTSDVRALVKPEAPADRIAACWYASTSLAFDVTISDSQTYQVALYLLDWDQQQRAETVSVIDPATGTILDTQAVSAFGTGVYVVWQVSGQVTIQVTNGAGSPNAVVSALFLAPA